MSQFLRKHGFIYDQLPVILWALFIFISSSIPNIALPEFKVFSSDKLAHLIVYGVFTALTHRALAYQNRFPKLAMHSLLWSFILTVIYGALDELHQFFVPPREASLLDLVADSVSALLFVAYKLLTARAKPPAAKAD